MDPLLKSRDEFMVFFSLLVFLLLAARTSFCLFLVRNTRVLFQMRHKCDVSMEACELCMFYLSPMLFFFSFSLHFFQDTTTPGWDLLILELLFSIRWNHETRLLFSFHLVKKKSLFFFWLVFFFRTTSQWNGSEWLTIRSQPKCLLDFATEILCESATLSKFRLPVRHRPHCFSLFLALAQMSNARQIWNKTLVQ